MPKRESDSLTGHREARSGIGNPIVCKRLTCRQIFVSHFGEQIVRWSDILTVLDEGFRSKPAKIRGGRGEKV